MSLRSSLAHALSSGFVALTERRKPSGSPRSCSNAANASKGDERMTPPKSKSAALITGPRYRPSARPTSVEEVVGDGVPEVGREPQRVDVDPLVVAVEHRAVVLEAHVLA